MVAQTLPGSEAKSGLRLSGMMPGSLGTTKLLIVSAGCAEANQQKAGK
jgi:hypothetical protein